MLRIQLIGLPLRCHRRFGDDFEEWSASIAGNVNCRPVPSFNENIPEISTVEINKIRENASEGFVHLFIVTPMRGNSFRLVAESFRFDCRTVRLDLGAGTDFRYLEWPEIAAVIDEAAGFENRWRSVLLPKDLNSCLLLPPPCFEPREDFKNFWSKCDIYADPVRLGAAHNLLAQVTARHRKSLSGQSAFWLDERGHKYTPDRSLHGRSPEEREGMNRYRFCFQIPSGFHYDVVKDSGGRFSVTDHTSREHHIERANIDSWGRVLPRN